MKSKDELVSYFLTMNGIFKYVRDSLSLQGTSYNVTGNILGYQQLQDYPGGYVLQSDEKGKILLVGLRKGNVLWMNESIPGVW